MADHTKGALGTLVGASSDSALDSDASDRDFCPRVHVVVHLHVLVLGVPIVCDRLLRDKGLTCELDQVFSSFKRDF